jgi:RNA polymerase sigma-70 factor (ECF subfamily)
MNVIIQTKDNILAMRELLQIIFMSQHLSNPEWYFQFSNGTTLSVKEFIEKHSNFLKIQVYNHVKDADDVKDILQDVIIKIYKHKDRFDSERSLIAYILKSCKNASIDFQKKKNKEQTTMENYQALHSKKSQEMQDEEAYMKAKLLSKVYKKWQTLSPKQRDILKQTYVDGASNKEIAHRLKTTEAYIKTQKYKILKNFKDHLN